LLSWWGSGRSKDQLSFNLSGFQSLLGISNPAQNFLPTKFPVHRDALKSCLALAGQSDVANGIEKDSLTLIEKSGFAEYYDPITGAPCGGGQFTWTAAMVIEFIKQSKAVA
jgi:hypothetical protein